VITTHLDIIEGNARFLIDLIKTYRVAPEAPALEQMQILIGDMEKDLGRFREQEESFEASVRRAEESLKRLGQTFNALHVLQLEAEIMTAVLKQVQPC
jgi:hypothetical protein